MPVSEEVQVSTFAACSWVVLGFLGAVWQQCCNCRRLYEGDFIGITKLPCQRLVARPWTLATPASTWLQAPQHSNGKRGNSDLKASSGSAASTLCSATSKDTQAAIHREHTTDISSQLRSNAHQGGVTRGTRQADTRAVTHFAPPGSILRIPRNRWRTSPR